MIEFPEGGKEQKEERWQLNYIREFSDVKKESSL